MGTMLTSRTSVVFSNANRLTMYSSDPNVRYYLLKVIDCCPAGQINHLESSPNSYVLDDGIGTIGFFSDAWGGTRFSDANYANQSGSQIESLLPLPGQSGSNPNASLADNQGAWSWVPSPDAPRVTTPGNLAAVTSNVAVIGPPRNRQPLIYYIENFVWMGNRTDYLIMKADKSVIDPCTGTFNGTLKLRFTCYKPCQWARDKQQNNNWQTLDIFQIAGIAGTTGSRQKGGDIDPKSLGDRAGKEALYFHDKNQQAASFQDVDAALAYERVRGKDLSTTTMIDFPVGATLEFQIVGGWGATRTVSTSHGNCLVLNGYNNVTSITLNENYTNIEAYLPELTSLAPQFTLEVAQNLVPMGQGKIFPKFIFDRSFSDGKNNRNHVFSIKCKNLGATTLYISDEEGCTVAYNINVVASWCTDFTEGLEDKTGLNRTVIAHQRQQNLMGLNEELQSWHKKLEDLGMSATTYADLVKLFGHITRKGDTSQVPMYDDWAFLKYQYGGVAGDEQFNPDANRAWCDCEVLDPDDVGREFTPQIKNYWQGTKYPIGNTWVDHSPPNTYKITEKDNENLFFCGSMKNCRTYIDGSRNYGTFEFQWDVNSMPRVNIGGYRYNFQTEDDIAKVPAYRWVDLQKKEDITVSTDKNDIFKLNITKTIGNGRGGFMRWGMDYGYGVNKMRVYLPKYFTHDTEGRRTRWGYKILRRGEVNPKGKVGSGDNTIFKGAGWIQDDSYEGSSNDQEFVRVSTNRNLGYVTIEFLAVTNFLPVVIRFYRNIYRVNGISRPYDVNNLFPQDGLRSPHCVVVGPDSPVLVGNDGNGDLATNIILSRKLFQLDSNGFQRTSNLFSKPIAHKTYTKNRQYAFAPFTQADLFVSAMCINPQVEAIVANETLDGTENFVYKGFEPQQDFPQLPTAPLTIANDNIGDIDPRLFATEFIPLKGLGLKGDIFDGAKEQESLFRFREFLASGASMGSLAQTIFDSGPITDVLNRDFKILLAVYGAIGGNFDIPEKPTMDARNPARVFLADHLYVDDKDDGKKWGMIEGNPISSAQVYKKTDGNNAKIYEIDIKLSRKGKTDDPNSWNQGMLCGKIPGFIYIDNGLRTQDLHYIFGKVGKFNTKIDDKKVKFYDQNGDVIFGTYMKQADVKNQFNTYAQNSSSELFENYYKDQWNGMFTQVRGASPIIPFVLTYIRTASWVYHSNALNILREQKKEALWGINAISAAESIKDSIKNNVASVPTNLDPEQIKQGLKFEKFWKYLE